MKERGLTLIELLAVVAILAILAAVMYANFSDAGATGRDTERKGDLRELQSAIELYKAKYGRYPERCPSGSPWSGEVGTEHECNSGSQYIIGLAPEFITSLPRDPRLNGNDSGYVYTVNSAGTVYKIMARNTVETETVDYNHPFKSCDVTASGGGVCSATYPSNSKPSWCEENNAIFESSYGLWSGFADPSNPTESRVERYTEDVICDVN